jgi:hypothetical protein
MSYGTSRVIALRALDGVGDATLGEWEQKGTYPILHVRRRLSAAEQTRYGLNVRDIRGTREERERLAALSAAVPGLASHPEIWRQFDEGGGR